MQIKVLYEDNHLLAVYKPAGVLTQADKTGDISLLDEVKKYLKEKYRKPGNVYLGMIHRLDRPASGIVLFAKTSKGASRLSWQFREQTVEKIYHALVLGKIEQKSGTLISFLKKDPAKNLVKVYKTAKNGGEKAELSFAVISQNNKYSLLEIKLKTGKSHQVRAQLADFGHPVVGDLKYGAAFALPDKSIYLCATSLSFNLATTPERKTITIPVPASWQKYLL